jgi:hypothetical protein
MYKGTEGRRETEISRQEMDTKKMGAVKQDMKKWQKVEVRRRA